MYMYLLIYWLSHSNAIVIPWGPASYCIVKADPKTHCVPKVTTFIFQKFWLIFPEFLPFIFHFFSGQAVLEYYLHTSPICYKNDCTSLFHSLFTWWPVYNGVGWYRTWKHTEVLFYGHVDRLYSNVHIFWISTGYISHLVKQTIQHIVNAFICSLKLYLLLYAYNLNWHFIEEF